MTTETAKVKKAFDDAFTKGVVCVVFNPRVGLTSVPLHLWSSNAVALNFGWGNDPHDTKSDEQGVSQTMTFRGNQFTVFVEWNAILKVTNLGGDVFYRFGVDNKPKPRLELVVDNTVWDHSPPRGQLRLVPNEPEA